MDSDYTPGELMVAAAAREIRDGEVVFVGMRLPLLAFCVAKGTHAPSAVGLFEAGVIRDSAAPEMLYTMCDPPNIASAAACLPMATLMGLLQRGDVDLGFIGGAEVDRFGNLNTSYIGPVDRPTVRLPGSGGAADIAGLARRLVTIMPHERRRFKTHVDYMTSPGFGDGLGWRARNGVPGGGPSALITTLGVFRFDSDTHEAVLHSIHPGVTLEQVVTETGFELRVSSELEVTPRPTDEELSIIRGYDPDGFWTGA
jgi:glutaconate CoA-transferase, subunit B